MLHLTVLASGSSGNCTLVETPPTRVLVDAGLSAKRVADRLAAAGIAPEQLDGILLTHEHSDHAAAVGVWGRRHGTPVFANRLTAEALANLTKGMVKVWDDPDKIKQAVVHAFNFNRVLN